MKIPFDTRTPSALLLVLFFFGLAGCDSNSQEGLAGPYTLTSVNGTAIPVMVTAVAGEFTIESGEMELNSDGTFDFSFSGSSDPIGPSGPSDFTASNSGTFSRSGDSVSFDGTQGNFSGTVVGDAIDAVVQVSGLVLTFRFLP
jgi:hypothetical protein